MKKNEGFSILELEKINKDIFKGWEIYQEELDKQTKNGKPSDRIKFLYTGSLCSQPKSGWIQAILNYLDEQYERNKTK